MRKNLVELVLERTGLKQADLAEQLGVSRAQISKWKAGESIPYERAQALRQIGNLFTDDTEWALLASNEENASAWTSYMMMQNELADFRCYLFADRDSAEMFTRHALIGMSNAGIPIPSKAPQVNLLDESAEESAFDILVGDFFDGLSCYTTWTQTFLFSFENNDILEKSFELEHYAIDLAIACIELENLEAVRTDLSQHELYSKKQLGEAREQIKSICNQITTLGLPIMEDYYAFVNHSPYELEDYAIVTQSLVAAGHIETHLPYGQRQLLS